MPKFKSLRLTLSLYKDFIIHHNTLLFIRCLNVFKFTWVYQNTVFVLSMSQLYLCEISKFKISSIVVNFNPDLLGLIHQRYIKIFHVQTKLKIRSYYSRYLCIEENRWKLPWISVEAITRLKSLSVLKLAEEPQGISRNFKEPG